MSIEKFGDKPTSLFAAGFHGDEKGIIGRLRNVLNQRLVENYNAIGDHARVFRAHVKAILNGPKGTREADGIDLNRIFIEPIEYKPAQELAEILDSYPQLRFAFLFHEDTGICHDGTRAPTAFHLYDYFSEETPEEKQLIEKQMDKLRNALISAGFEIFNGKDDKTDPLLNNLVTEGYCKIPKSKAKADGSFEVYAMQHGVERTFVLEFPSFPELPPQTRVTNKQKMMEIVFDNFIIPFLNNRTTT